MHCMDSLKRLSQMTIGLDRATQKRTNKQRLAAQAFMSPRKNSRTGNGGTSKYRAPRPLIDSLDELVSPLAYSRRVLKQASSEADSAEFPEDAFDDLVHTINFLQAYDGSAQRSTVTAEKSSACCNGAG